jgi:hypothetical protein
VERGRSDNITMNKRHASCSLRRLLIARRAGSCCPDYDVGTRNGAGRLASPTERRGLGCGTPLFPTFDNSAAVQSNRAVFDLLKRVRFFRPADVQGTFESMLMPSSSLVSRTKGLGVEDQVPAHHPSRRTRQEPASSCSGLLRGRWTNNVVTNLVEVDLRFETRRGMPRTRRR